MRSIIEAAQRGILEKVIDAAERIEEAKEAGGHVQSTIFDWRQYRIRPLGEEAQEFARNADIFVRGTKKKRNIGAAIAAGLTTAAVLIPNRRARDVIGTLATGTAAYAILKQVEIFNVGSFRDEIIP